MHQHNIHTQRDDEQTAVSPLISFARGCRLLHIDPRTAERAMRDPQSDLPRAVWVVNRRFFFRQQVLDYLRAKAAEAGLKTLEMDAA